MRIEVTTSEFVNQILKEFRPGNSLKDLVVKHKGLIKSELDKYIYNELSEDDKIETTFDIVKESQSIVSKNVPQSGPADTPYGEWLRAFNKLMYRLFNDGDHVLCGYFSALNFYLSYDCTTNFRFEEFGFFKFDVYDTSIENANEIDESAQYLSEFILALCNDKKDYGDSFYPDMISESMKKNSETIGKWWQLIVIMTDILDSYLKNVNNTHVKPCDSYYKNGMDYIDHELYEFLSCTCHENNWLCDNDNPESCMSFRDKTEDISIIKLSSYNYEIHMDLHNFGAIFFSSFEFNLKVDSDREKVEELFSIYRRYKSNNNSIQDVITLGEFLKFYNGYKNILNKSIVVELFTKTEDGDYRELIKTFDKIQDLIDDTEFVKMYKLHKWFCPIHESEHRILQVIVNHDNEKSS